MLPRDSFDPVQFITALTDMSTWNFPYDALAAGISGTVDWLQEDEHLFLSPVPTVTRCNPSEMSKDAAVLTEFFPGAVLPFDSPESFESYGQEVHFEREPSDYSPQGYEKEKNVYQTNQWVLPAPPSCNAPRQLHFAYSIPETFPVTETPPSTPFDDYSPPRRPLGSINNKSKVGLEEKKACANCGTTTPSMWRWNYRGERECNACCLFESHNGTRRPSNMWKNKPIKRRKRTRVAKAGLGETDESVLYSPY